ncbi:7-alpha-hydroxysteroid dehydrogenase [Saccharata proteae CBS 121410]|uniref:7-alpha-hydroxysteroid dehydrogenase n=1 Tax=Saccharata proteae CBS 121410 TaxID=1314787 RepID=A0A9P4I1S4_9PEZI|nr:7-alpha-hydroxysteroid dehydrogenase [Saccharata proteae CBS 121410]
MATTTSAAAEAAGIGNLFDVKGRVALVTGGSSGIGLMIAKGLVRNGAIVYITALESDPITAAVTELNSLGKASGSEGRASGFPSDLTTKSGIAALAAHVQTLTPNLDILISNAGIRRDAPEPCNPVTADLSTLQSSLWSHSHGDWTDTFAVNTTAHFFLVVALVHLLAAAAEKEVEGGEDGVGEGGAKRRGRDVGRGVVVVTSSCASMHNCTNVDLTSYAASKAATDHLVRLLASKFARWYVRVVGVNPGFVPSAMNPIGAEGNMFAGLFDKVPARRAGRLGDIAGTVLYLCSEAGAYVDGTSLCVDGGRVLVANGQE